MNYRDDWAEPCLHTELFDRAEYRLYSRGKKVPCQTRIKQERECIRE